MTDVSIRPCADYEPEALRQALLEVLAPFGGLDWVKPGMKIGIKTNLVSMMSPDTAATTHPEPLCVLTRLLRERGAEVILGDSPGGLYNHTYVNQVYRAAGMHQVEAAGARLNQDFSTAEASYPEAAELKSFTYTRWLDDCDVLINFCKLKTHGMMGLSAAAKNLFGVIPGTMKPEYHYRFPTPERFSQMILDLDEYFLPRIHLCDAVVGMEGNGPTQGTPRHIGALLAAENPHKLDLLAARLIDLDPRTVPTLVAAMGRGYCPETVDDLRIDGDYRPFIVPDYQRIERLDGVLFGIKAPGFLSAAADKFLRAALQSRPGPDKGACIGCAKCEKICPAHAITMEKKKPRINRKRCIGCFCCQEFCPVGAMKVTRPRIAGLLMKTP